MPHSSWGSPVPEAYITRRTLIGRGMVSVAALLLLPGRMRGQTGQQGQKGEDTPAAPRLYDPARAGQPQRRVTDYENDPFVVGIEGRLRCTCGCNLDVYTCRTTDFNCSVSPAMHREVVALVQQGKSAQEITDAFVAEYGEMVLMAPKKEGLNLLAYFVPGAAIIAVGSTLLWALSKRTRRLAPAAQLPSDRPGGLSDEDQAKLDAELRGLEI